MSTGGPSDPVRRTRIRWGTGGGVIGLVVGVIGGLLVGGNLTVLGVGAVGAVAAVAGVVLTATGQVMAHSDRRYTRGKDERDRLERAESRARARAEGASASPCRRRRRGVGGLWRGAALTTSSCSATRSGFSSPTGADSPSAVSTWRSSRPWSSPTWRATAPCPSSQEAAPRGGRRPSRSRSQLTRPATAPFSPGRQW